ncbi:alpha/beta fold hydrolase [Nigerium massiliense]|uniref:alpha/beta fold hydrolase n=1 Tax=Nigerium massiliense TaxID=1522317 RepID=UPI0009E44A0E|nr:alpha/beta hydrolase [Nigerium massiliense]
MRLLVFLHGVGQMPQVWQDQVSAMPGDFRAVAPWLRGTRPGRPEPFDLDAAADDVLGILNQQGVETMALCGISAGAAVALRAATRSPEAVSHLVLTGTQIVTPSASALRAQRLALRFTPTRMLRSRGIDKQRTMDTLAHLEELDIDAGLDTVTARTLIVTGDQDRPALEAASDLAERLADARLEVVEGSGADVPVQQPAAFNDLLYGFLAQG